MTESLSKGIAESDRIGSRYNVQPEIPDAYLAHWIFIINEKEITVQQIRAMSNIYQRKTLKNEDNSFFYQPYGSSLEMF